MMISVIIGLVQILLGKAIGAYKKGLQKGWRHSLAGYAWVLLLVLLAPGEQVLVRQGSEGNEHGGRQ